MGTVIAAVVVGIIVLAVIVRLTRSSSFKQGYTQTYAASRRVTRVSSARLAAQELLNLIEEKRDIAPFYLRLNELVRAGTFGRSITQAHVEETMTDPNKLVDIVRTLTQIAR